MRGEESPGNKEHCTAESADIREGIVLEQKITVSLWLIRVKRQGKSLPVQMATFAAVQLAGCKTKYTGQ